MCNCVCVCDILANRDSVSACCCLLIIDRFGRRK